MTSNQVSDAIEMLCQKLNVAQSALVPEMAKLCMTRAIVNAAICAVLFIALVIACFVCVSRIDDEISAFILVWIVTFAIGVFAFLWYSASTAIQWAVAPNAKAAEYILRLLGGGR